MASNYSTFTPFVKRTTEHSQKTRIPKPPVVDPVSAAVLASRNRKLPGRPAMTRMQQSFKQLMPSTSAGILPIKSTKPSETNAINMSSYILKLVPPMKKSATFVLEDPAVASTSSSNYSGSASPLLPPPRIVDEAKLKKRRSASVGPHKDENKVPVNIIKPSKIPILINKEEIIRRQKIVSIQTQEREREEKFEVDFEIMRAKWKEEHLKLVEKKDRDLIRFRKQREELQGIKLKPTRLVERLNEQSKQPVANNPVKISKGKELARRRSSSLLSVLPQMQVMSPSIQDDPSIPLFDENSETPAFHKDEGYLLSKATAKNPKLYFKALKETSSRVGTPPRAPLGLLKNESEQTPNNCTKRLCNQVSSLYSKE